MLPKVYSRVHRHGGWLRVGPLRVAALVIAREYGGFDGYPKALRKRVGEFDDDRRWESPTS